MFTAKPIHYSKQKLKYRGMFETQKSGNKTSSREIGLNIRTLASRKVGQDQVSGGVSVLCWHAAPVANVLWKPEKSMINVKSTPTSTGQLISAKSTPRSTKLMFRLEI